MYSKTFFFLQYAIHSIISFQYNLYINVKKSHTKSKFNTSIDRFEGFLRLKALQHEQIMHYQMNIPGFFTIACMQWAIQGNFKYLMSKCNSLLTTITTQHNPTQLVHSVHSSDPTVLSFFYFWFLLTCINHQLFQ